MNKEELRALVAQLLQERSTAQLPTAPQVQTDDTDLLPDITQIDLRKLYLVDAPQNGTDFLALKARTPARLGAGRAGARYRTETLLRFRADHAAAQDSVFSLVPEDFAKAHGWIPVTTE